MLQYLKMLLVKHIKNFLFAQNVLVKCLDLFLPNSCILCKQFTQSHSEIDNIRTPHICIKCWNTLNFISNPCCENCSAPLEYDGKDCLSCKGQEFAFDSIRSAIVYTSASKKMFTQFKHNNKTEYARIFAIWLHRVMPVINTDMVIPMPLHKYRLYKRSYNQAALIAKAFLNLHKTPNLIPLECKAIKRVKNTPYQGHKNKHERYANMENAFLANPQKVYGKRILLIDDVMTTGASLHHCAQSLKEQGAIRVDVLVVARAIIQDH